ncbi:MAG: HlyD family efflux transporter periplasmic adaptor subunit, partial [Pseudomonadota bacterium]
PGKLHFHQFKLSLTPGCFGTSDLLLEQLKLRADRNQKIIQQQAATAVFDLSKARILDAETARIEAQLELVEVQLARARIVAPIDGVVVSGDLTQLIGAPRSKGDELFNLATAEGYRIVLKVDERDIAAVSPGQKGSLILTAMPERQFDFEISRLTSVLEVADGRNFYRVEGKLKENATQFRAGLEGYARIVVGQKSVLSIWTEDVTRWVKLKFWAWRP